MLKLLLATVVAFPLTACASPTLSLPKTEPIVLPELPANIRVCQKLKTISERAEGRVSLSFEEMRVLWAEDRIAAAQCNRRLNALVNFYSDLKADLQSLSEPEE